MFGLLKKSSNENSQQQAIFHSSSKNLFSTFDEFVTVQERLRKPHERPNQRCREQSRPSRDEADQRRRFLPFDVQEICDNFEKEMMKILKDASKIHKKSTSTRAPVAEPSLFISEKPKGKSENSLEDLKDFSDSLPIFDEYDEELMESLITCEDECDLPSPKHDLMFDIDNKETNGLTCFEPEHPSSLVLVSQEDELGPIFDEEAPSITSIIMENRLCFDPGTTPTPLSKEHCKELCIISFVPDLFDKVSSNDIIRSGLDHLEKSFELDLQQLVFCSRKPFDSFVFKENSFSASSYRYALITGYLFASTCTLDEFMVKTLLEQKSHKAKTDFCCDSVLKSNIELLYSNSDHVRHVLKMSYDISCLESILIYNTFFDKNADPWINHIFDEEDELGPIFDEEAPSITSIIMENRLCFDPGTTPTPLSKEHCKELCIISFVPDLFDKVSSNDIIRSGLDHLEKSFELDLQQLVFCSRKPFDSFVFKENSFSASSYRYALITGYLFASTCTLDEFMVKTLLEQKSHKAKTDFCCDSVLKSNIELLYSNSDHVRHVLKMSYDISCLESILIYNTFFDKNADPWIRKETVVFDLNKYLSCTYDSELVLFLGESYPSKHLSTRWSCESYQATVRDSSFGGLVSHIKHRLKSGISKAIPQPSCNPSIHLVLHSEFISRSDPFE
ncbi:hypothetical protein F2Q69_00053049 [Brassica cretica]|uniref:Uncharacterized protein n=1 Tax=Brassica cretica TaxID=69181 RepID=A0A8S9MVP9_BRACR|nr:hypothetical protein F2Q69_00053049 [Brassica cretica]